MQQQTNTHKTRLGNTLFNSNNRCTHFQKKTIICIVFGEKIATMDTNKYGLLDQPQGNKKNFMLKSTKHGISTAHKNLNTEK